MRIFHTKKCKLSVIFLMIISPHMMMISPPMKMISPYMQKTCDVAGMAFLAKKIGGKFGLKMA